MRNGARELDMCHALASNLGLSDLYAALFTYDTAMLEPLVLPAKTLVVLDRPKNFRAEQPVTFWFERPVVDRLRFLDLAE